jgi:hypothetical protein
MAFSSRHWTFHHINLKKVVRQSEKDLITAIHQLSTGDISLDTDSFLRTLRRSIPASHPIYIFGTRDEVGIHNLRMIAKLEGPSVTYRATDSGKESALDKFVNVSKHLQLKLEAPVILQKNLSDQLVNGLQGMVRSLDKDGPSVFFPSLNITTKIKKEIFSVYGNANQTIAQRRQIPLALGYAITAHKSQGMPLDEVVVDCRYMKNVGQVGVAVGRVRSSAGIQLKNYRGRGSIPKVADEIKEFYQLDAKVVADDISCCKVNDLSEDFRKS